jgi:hypothetical protein
MERMRRLERSEGLQQWLNSQGTKSYKIAVRVSKAELKASRQSCRLTITATRS